MSKEGFKKGKQRILDLIKKGYEYDIWPDRKPGTFIIFVVTRKKEGLGIGARFKFHELTKIGEPENLSQ